MFTFSELKTCCVNVFFGLKSHSENGQSPIQKTVKNFVGCTDHTHNLTPIFVGKKVQVVHN